MQADDLTLSRRAPEIRTFGKFLPTKQTHKEKVIKLKEVEAMKQYEGVLK